MEDDGQTAVDLESKSSGVAEVLDGCIKCVGLEDGYAIAAPSLVSRVAAGILPDKSGDDVHTAAALQSKSSGWLRPLLFELNG